MQRTASRAAGVLRTRVSRLSADDRIALRRLAAAALATHGLLHAMGVALLWQWNSAPDAHVSVLNPTPGSVSGIAVGGLWLLAGALFVSAGLLLARGRPSWRPVATIAVLVSAPALLPFSGAALYGLLADSAVVIGIVLSRADRPIR
jgi:hypothetical protein